MGGPFSRAAGRNIVPHPAPFVKRKIEQILAWFEIPICAICQLTSGCPCGTIQLQKGRGRQPERDFKKIKKGLDKLPNLWYNKGVKREERLQKRFQKNFKKTLDKPPKVWYNKYRKRGEEHG